MRKLFKTSFLFLSSLLVSLSARAEDIPYFNMPKGVTPISKDIYFLHMTLLWICTIIGIIVFSIMFYALYKHRKSRGKKPRVLPASYSFEIVLAIIPFLILVAMAVPATKVLIKMEDASDAQVNIKIVGYQWKWKYEYLDEGIGFFSNLSTPLKELQNKAPKGEWYLLEVDKPLVVPINQKIRFLVTSSDVIHSWWVPALGIKRDAIPGFIYESWAKIEKPGTYRGQCAELCGINHAYMPIVVKAVPEEEYQAWIKAQRASMPKQRGEQISMSGLPSAIAPLVPAAKAALAKTPPRTWTRDELMKHGETVYNNTCAVCHKVDGHGMPPAFPSMVGGKVATGPMAKHIDTVVHGVKGTAMQAFGEQLSDDDIAAVITYERNSWGNSDQKRYGKDAGGLVQPKMIDDARN